MKHDEINAKLLEAVIDLAGGREVEDALQRHHGQGLSYTRIADEMGVHKTTLIRRCDRMRAVLAKHGLLPELWKRH